MLLTYITTVEVAFGVRQYLTYFYKPVFAGGLEGSKNRKSMSSIVIIVYVQ